MKASFADYMCNAKYKVEMRTPGLLLFFSVLRFSNYKHNPGNLSTRGPERPSEISAFVVFKQPLVQKMSMKTSL